MRMRPAAVLTAFTALLWTAACSKPAPPPETAKSSPAPAYFHVDPATAGTLAGKVVLKGPPPPRKRISMQTEAGCEQAHAGRPVYDDTVIAARDGALANAFVYIESGLEGRKFEPAAQPATLDQHGCMFIPRVIGIRPAQVLRLNNSDAVSHNIHPIPRNNREWNEEEAPHSPPVEHRFARTEVMIPVKCNIHAWMRAWIGVVDHPYFAVTGADGSFELKSIPPGDYTLAVWHETLGERKLQVHIDPKANAAVNFTYP